jgi:hypothetical protein
MKDKSQDLPFPAEALKRPLESRTLENPESEWKQEDNYSDGSKLGNSWSGSSILLADNSKSRLGSTTSSSSIGAASFGTEQTTEFSVLQEGQGEPEHYESSTYQSLVAHYSSEEDLFSDGNDKRAKFKP